MSDIGPINQLPSVWTWIYCLPLFPFLAPLVSCFYCVMCTWVPTSHTGTVWGRRDGVSKVPPEYRPQGPLPPPFPSTPFVMSMFRFLLHFVCGIVSTFVPVVKGGGWVNRAVGRNVSVGWSLSPGHNYFCGNGPYARNDIRWTPPPQHS